MSKRGATTVLTHDNWDQEQESEDPGTFESADRSALARRPIKTAKRRKPPITRTPTTTTNQEEPKGGGVFAGFAGFGAKKAESSTAHVPSVKTPPSSTDKPAPKTFQEACRDSGINGSRSIVKVAEATKETGPSPLEKKYVMKLRRLNEQVSAWIAQNVKENPYVDLTPIFSDYKKHLGDMEASYKEAQRNNTPDNSGKVEWKEKGEGSKGKDDFVVPANPAKKAKADVPAPSPIAPTASAVQFGLSRSSAGSDSIPKLSFGSSGDAGTTAKTTTAASTTTISFNKETTASTEKKATWGWGSGARTVPGTADTPPVIGLGIASSEKTKDSSVAAPKPVGFSFGISPSNTSTPTPTFSFGGQKPASPPGGEAKKPLTFGFGAGTAVGATEGNIKIGGRSFGSMGGANPAPFAFGMSAPPSGSGGEKKSESESGGGEMWTCGECWVKNKADASACICCTTPKPLEKKSTLAVTTTTTASEITGTPLSFGSTSSGTLKADSVAGGGGGGGGGGEGQWTCGECWVKNKAEAVVCICCTFPKPGSAPKTTNTSSSTTKTSGSLGGTPFKFGAITSSGASGGFPSGGFGLSTSGKDTGTPFSFGVVSAKTGDQGTNSQPGEKEDPVYEPPKVETVEIEEPDAFHQIKCKLFYKKAEKYVEKAVGTLYLKNLEASDKTQLLIRDGTSLGTILLNIQVEPGMAWSRVGKNNVSLVCVPHPPMDPKASEEEKNTPISLLIRVKTGEDADVLIQKIKGEAKD